jgi:hypothetical protein
MQDEQATQISKIIVSSAKQCVLNITLSWKSLFEARIVLRPIHTYHAVLLPRPCHSPTVLRPS